MGWYKFNQVEPVLGWEFMWVGVAPYFGPTRSRWMPPLLPSSVSRVQHASLQASESESRQSSLQAAQGGQEARGGTGVGTVQRR